MIVYRYSYEIGGKISQTTIDHLRELVEADRETDADWWEFVLPDEENPILHISGNHEGHPDEIHNLLISSPDVHFSSTFKSDKSASFGIIFFDDVEVMYPVDTNGDLSMNMRDVVDILDGEWNPDLVTMVESYRVPIPRLTITPSERRTS